MFQPTYYAMKEESGLVDGVIEQAKGGLTAVVVKGVYFLAGRDCPEVIGKVYGKLEDLYYHCFER